MTVKTQLPFPARLAFNSKEMRPCHNHMMQAIIKDITELSIDQAQNLSDGNLSMDEITISQTYEEMGFSGQWLVDFTHFATQEAMKVVKNQLSYAKTAIAALTVYGGMDSNVSNWDMNHLALMGFYLEKNFKDVNGDIYEFCGATAAWTRIRDGEDFNFHPESGEPVLSFEANNVIAGEFI